MTPKEKAEELISKYIPLTLTDFSDENFEQTKKCTSTAVDELIKENYPNDIKRCEYWKEVKQEIEKL